MSTIITFDDTKLLGEGSYGTEVYSGKYGNTDAAVKVFQISKKSAETLHTELSILHSKINGEHKNVIKYYGFMDSPKVLLATELCTTSLELYVNECYSKQPGSFKAYTQPVCHQILEGLSFLHDNGIIHGDLTPSNILLIIILDEITVKIADFGMSRMMPSRWYEVARSSSGVGTSEWMPPEVLKSVQEFEKKRKNLQDIHIETTFEVDIFSAGCLFYFAATEGCHLYGQMMLRQGNILRGHRDWQIRDVCTDFHPLMYSINFMTATDPRLRPKASTLLTLPVFWDQVKTKQFLEDFHKILTDCSSNIINTRRLLYSLDSFAKLPLVHRSLTKSNTPDFVPAINLPSILSDVIEYILEVKDMDASKTFQKSSILLLAAENLSSFVFVLWEAFCANSSSMSMDSYIFAEDFLTVLQRLHEQPNTSPTKGDPGTSMSTLENHESFPKTRNESIQTMVSSVDQNNDSKFKVNIARQLDLTKGKILDKMKIGHMTRWYDLDISLQNEILQCQVEFLGATNSLSSVLSKFNEKKINEILNVTLTNTLMKEIFQSRKLYLTCNLLPEMPSVYIPRTMNTRRKIDPKIFEAECPDIFVIQNIGLLKLSEFSGKHRVDKSYRQAEHLTARFISLDSPDHFEDICDQAKLNSVHLIDFKSQDFYWVKTHGNLHQIQAHLHEDQEFIPESEFLNLEIQNNVPICIADNPGMGKTLLLANICQRRRSQSPEKYMIYANFVNIFGMESNVYPLTECKPTEKTWQNVVHHVSKNETGRELLTEVFMTEPQKLELFLDGFDEIPTSQLHLAVNCLKSLAINLKGAQIYATTRVHRQVELERALGTFSFNILPFSESDQINFFRDIWSKVYYIPNTPHLEKIANFLVAEVSSKFSSKENGITGVPLQCSMLAEIYHKSAKRNAKQLGEHHEISIRINSIHEMYEKLLKLRFQKLEDETRRKEVLRVHQMAAFELLLPSTFLEHSKELFGNMPTRSTVWEEVNCLGLLTFQECSSDGERIRFLHRTYAEFILADWWVTSFHQLNNRSSSISLHAQLNSIHGRFDTQVRSFDASIKVLFEILDFETFDGGIKLNTTDCDFNVIWKKLCGSKNIEKCRQEWLRVARALNLGPEDIATIHGKIKYNLERKDSPENDRDILWLMLWQWTDNYKRQPLLAELVDALHFCGFEDLAVSLESSYYSKSFHHHTLCFFLNTCLEKYEITLSPSTSDDFMIPSIGNILESCLSHDFMNIFQMISRYCLSVKDRPFFQRFYKNEKWAGLLVKVIKRSSATQLEECCSFVEEMEGKPLYQIQTSGICFGGWEYTPLHAACERGDVSSFLFLSKKYGERVFEMKSLLHFCTHHSLNDSEEVVNGKMGMIDHLLKINPAFLEEREPSFNSTPILMDRVHLRLLEFLMGKGANARAVDEDGDTLVHQAAIHFSPEDFRRLTELLIEKGCGDVFLIRNKEGESQFRFRFQWARIKVETVQLIVTHVNILDSEVTTMLGLAVAGLQKLEILETLVKFGADPKEIDSVGMTMIHLAALHGNVDAIGYLCLLGCDVNARDLRQRTPLHAVVTMGRRNLDEVVMALLELQINVKAIDDEGRSALWYAEKLEDFRKLRPATLQALQGAASS